MTADKSQAGEPKAGVITPSEELLRKWAMAPYWQAAEGVALAFGYDPDGAILEFSLDDRELGVGGLANHFVKLAKRAIACGDLPKSPTPAEFITWGKRVELGFHENWERRLLQSRLAHRKKSSTSGNRRPTSIEIQNALIAEWAKAPSWTHAEGVALSLNLHPRVIKTRTTRSISEGSPEISRRLDFARRAKSNHELYQHPTPAEFIKWADGVGFRFDDAWYEVIPGEDGGLVTPSSNSENVSLSTREKDSLLKLVIGMAVAGYRFDPNQPRNTATGDIASDLERLGLSLDRDTILKWLRKGAELLPPQTEDE